MTILARIKTTFHSSIQWLARHESRLFGILLGLALTANILPVLVTEFLPFSDLPGHLGVVGANLLAHAPAARITHYFTLNPHFGPNSLEFGILLLMGKVVSLTTAARILVALSVTLLPLSVLALLSAFRRSPWLVFLALPFSYPRILWYGFLGASLGISFMFLTIATMRRAAEQPSIWGALAASALCFLAGLAHPFFLAGTLGLFALTWLGSLAEQPTSWKAWLLGAIPIPSLLVFGHWFTAMAAGKASAHPGRHESILEHILSKRPPWKVYRQWLEQWSLHGFKDRSLEQGILVVLAWTASILMLFVILQWTKPLWIGSWTLLTGRFRDKRRPDLGASSKGDGGDKTTHNPQPQHPLHRRILNELIPVSLLIATLGAYLLLPGVITYPVYWWAVAQRLVTPLLLLALLAIPSAVPARIARLAGLVGLGLGLLYAGFLTKDFARHFAGREMAGFHQLLDRIPPGKRLCALYDDREQHYAHFPLHFASAYYVALRGGFAMPFPRVAGYESIAWAYPKRVPPSPPWGKLRAFSFRRYGRFYDYFLVKTNADGKTRWRRRLPRRCFKEVVQKGLWILLERRKVPGC